MTRQPEASPQQQIKHKHYAFLEKHDWCRHFVEQDNLAYRHHPAAHFVVKSMTPPVDGFYPVGVGQTLMFETKTGEFIKILHCCSGHWLIVNTIGAQHPVELFVYDSTRRSDYCFLPSSLTCAFVFLAVFNSIHSLEREAEVCCTLSWVWYLWQELIEFQDALGIGNVNLLHYRETKKTACNKYNVMHSCGPAISLPCIPCVQQLQDPHDWRHLALDWN